MRGEVEPHPCELASSREPHNRADCNVEIENSPALAAKRVFSVRRRVVIGIKCAVRSIIARSRLLLHCVL